MKKLYLLLAFLLVMFLAVGCNNATTEDTSANTTAAVTTAAATTTAAVTTEPATTTEATTTQNTATTTVKGVITWGGTEDVTVVRGNAVDLKEGLTATDSIDGDISSSITITDDDDFTTSLAGGYVITYSVTNSTGVVSTVTRNYTVYVSYNVANGDFAIPSYGWTLDTPGGAASLTFSDEKAHVEITNPGNSWWAVQLYQSNVVFKEGVTYKLSVDVSSDDRASIAAGFEDINNGYAMLNPGFQAWELSSDTQTYEIYFTSPADISNVKVVIYLGYMLPGDEISSGSQTVTLDNINISEVDAAQNVTFTGVEDTDGYSPTVNFDPLSGVTAEDPDGNDVTSDIVVTGVVPDEVMVASTYYVTYMVTLSDDSFSFVNRKVNIAMSKDFEYQAINGEFDNGLAGWTQDVNQTQGTGAATFTDNGDGTVSILVSNVSDAGWHIQLQQASSTFKAGESYVVTITLKASADRKISVEVVDPSNGFAAIATGLNAVAVGTDWVTYEIPFTADKDYTNAKIGLLLGNVDGMQQNGITVTVDEFQVYRFGPYNENFDTTVEPWVQDHISAQVTDGAAVVTFVASGEDGSVAGTNPWENQLYQNSGSTLVAGHTYQVDVYLKSSVDRTIRAWIEDANNGYAAIATGSNTEISLTADTYALLTYTVTITDSNDTENAKFSVMFGDAGIAGVAHTVTIDYYHVTDVTNVE